MGDVMKRKTIIICLLILILLGVLGWYLFSHKKINYKEIYGEFISEKKYLKNFQGEINGKSYFANYDLDSDSVPELIITLKDGSGDFETNLIYRIKDEEVKYVGKAYHYGELVYDLDELAIVYSSERPSLAYGYVYQYYVLKDGRLKNKMNLITEITDGNYKYYISYGNDSKKELTKDELSKYMINLSGFTYEEIK